NVDMRHGITVEKNGALAVIKHQGANGDQSDGSRKQEIVTAVRSAHGRGGYAFASWPLPRYLSSSSASFCRVAAGILSLSVWMANFKAEPQAHVRSFGMMATARFTTLAAFSAFACTTFNTCSTVTSSWPAYQQS